MSGVAREFGRTLVAARAACGSAEEALNRILSFVTRLKVDESFVIGFDRSAFAARPLVGAGRVLIKIETAFEFAST